MDAVGVSATDVGKKRESNEDNCYVDNDIGLFIVCDGMGGHKAGEVASQLTVETIRDRVAGETALLDRVRRGQAEHSAIAKLIESAIGEACEKVHATARAGQGSAGMGTTVTMMIVAGNKAVMGHVGDSRLFLCRGGVVYQLSVDHTFVGQLVRSGAMTLEDAQKSPHRNVLTRAVGVQPSVAVETLEIDLSPGDRFVLCSDGLTEYIDGNALAPFLSRELESVADDLVAAANEGGGVDNITVIALEIAESDADREAVVELTPGVDVRLELLAATFLCRDLRFSHLQRVVNLCELESHDGGASIVSEGHEGDGLRVIVSGGVQVTRRGSALGDLGVGDSFGASFLVDERDANASAVAVGATVVLTIPRVKFETLATKRPWLGVALLGRIARHNSRALARCAGDSEIHPGHRV